jgi:hypothetical protein
MSLCAKKEEKISIDKAQIYGKRDEQIHKSLPVKFNRPDYWPKEHMRPKTRKKSRQSEAKEDLASSDTQFYCEI